MESYTNSTVRLLVCEPDERYAEEICRTVMSFPAFIQPVRCFRTLFAMESYVTDTMHGNVDVLIVPGDAEQELCIRTLRRLWEQFPHILVLFTAQEIVPLATRMFVDCRPYVPFGLLQKPLDEKLLLLNLEQALAALREKAASSFILKTQHGLASVAYAEIRYIESEKRILHVYLQNGSTYDSYLKLDIIADALPPQFFRIHQSYLVNLDYANMLTENSLLMHSGITLPVSRNYKTPLKERLFQLKGFC